MKKFGAALLATGIVLDAGLVGTSVLPDLTKSFKALYDYSNANAAERAYFSSLTAAQRRDVMQKNKPSMTAYLECKNEVTGKTISFWQGNAVFADRPRLDAILKSNACGVVLFGSYVNGYKTAYTL